MTGPARPARGGVTRAAGGVLGPAAFTAAWALLGRNRPGYSPVRDPVSRLAAVGAPSRPVMTAGLLVRAAGVAVYGTGLDMSAPAVGRAAVLSALATVGVAAFPLGWRWGDGAHVAAALASYFTLAAQPAVEARAAVGRGRRVWAAAGKAAAVVTGAALAASVVSQRRTGLYQRVGLTAGNAWVAASALRLLTGGRTDR